MGNSMEKMLLPGRPVKEKDSKVIKLPARRESREIKSEDKVSK